MSKGEDKSTVLSNLHHIFGMDGDYLQEIQVGDFTLKCALYPYRYSS